MSTLFAMMYEETKSIRRVVLQFALLFWSLWTCSELACERLLAGDPPPKRKHGLLLKMPEATPGYTLLAPLSSRETYLIDLEGNVVHSWEAEAKPGNSAYLLEDGSLLRCARVVETYGFLTQGGVGGRIQRFDWDNNLLWDFVYADEDKMHHHDVEWMPNGNVLLIAWERKTKQEAYAAGRSPETLTDDELWPETIVEIKPKGLHGGEVVWKWRLWDHLIQNYDETKPNFGDPAEHPELVNLNFGSHTKSDWVHMNSIRYNAKLDQILVSCNYFCELWIIDHSTTTEEAAGHTGGKSGKGGDLLYRWGNPLAYNMGTIEDRHFFGQHDARWIPEGYPGEGNILVFSNGTMTSERRFSSVEEIKPPLLPSGTYARTSWAPYGPMQLTWSYADPRRLFSAKISGAERLPNGHTLICSGTQGIVVEVTADGRPVWAYGNRPRLDPTDNSATGESDDDDHEKTTNGFALDDEEMADGREGDPDDDDDDPPRSGSAFAALIRAGRNRLGIPPDGGGTLFRAPRYLPDYPAFQGRNLPLKQVRTLEE